MREFENPQLLPLAKKGLLIGTAAREVESRQQNHFWQQQGLLTDLMPCAPDRVVGRAVRLSHAVAHVARRALINVNGERTERVRSGGDTQGSLVCGTSKKGSRIGCATSLNQIRFRGHSSKRERRCTTARQGLVETSFKTKTGRADRVGSPAVFR